MILGRKLHTASLIVRHCANWLPVLLTRLGFDTHVREVQVRRGPRIKIDLPLASMWGVVFEPAVADTYGIRNAEAEIIVDVGTNIGSFSCLAAYTHPKAKVYAFEPNPAASSQAKINFQHNSLRNVHLTESPVTRDGREVVLHLTESRGGVNMYQVGEGKDVALPSVTLDIVPFHDAKSIFFKLDCEGAEGEIIQWIASKKDELPPHVTIVCEYHYWCPVPLEKSVETLRASGFQAEGREEMGGPYLYASRG